MTNPVDYLLQLKGKPGFEEEFDRLKDTLCEEDILILKGVQLGESTQLIWNGFNARSQCKFLIVTTNHVNYKLIRNENGFLTEESGKTYSWEYNPYVAWAGFN